MRLIPVLDVMGGVVVRARGGARQDYRPLESQLTSSTAPAEVAAALCHLLGSPPPSSPKASAERGDHASPESKPEIYVADLDALMGRTGNSEIIRDLCGAGFAVWADAGVKNPQEALSLAAMGVAIVIVALETLATFDVLKTIGPRLGWDRLAFSLDLRGGKPLGSAGRGLSVPDIVAEVVNVGVRRLIVLDLADVGGGEGTSTANLCRDLAKCHAEVEIIAGGGVRGYADLERLSRAGVSAALVASALHDGQLTAWNCAQARALLA